MSHAFCSMEAPSDFSDQKSQWMQLTNIEFCSAPSSPKRCVSPFGQSRANSTIDEFEFETSCRFDFNDNEFNLMDRMEQKNKEKSQCDEDFPPEMAFADELFSEGKVLPLLPRLKLPPGLERGNDNRRGRSFTASSPRSPGSALKIKFIHQNLWNDDFDPFLVALQSVKEDGRGKTQANNRRQARAHSPDPRRPNNTSDQYMGPQLPLQQQPEEPMNSDQAHSENESRKSPKILSEPKGLAFARAVAKMDHKTGSRPNMTTMSGPIMKNRRNGERSYTRKRNKLMKLLSLFRKFSLKTVDQQHQPHER